MNRIDAHSRTVRELLNNEKYALDFYQRGYAWEDKHVQELLEDLSIPCRFHPAKDSSANLS